MDALQLCCRRLSPPWLLRGNYAVHLKLIGKYVVDFLTCSTVMLQCYRRQAIPVKQAKIRPSVTLYSLDRSLPNLVWLIMSATPTQMQVLVKFG